MKVRLFLSSTFTLAVLSMIRIYWIYKTPEDALILDQFQCPETKLGQEMYRLVMFYFIIVILLNLIIETIWSQLYQCYKDSDWFPVPEFDISRNTTNLIYCQVRRHAFKICEASMYLSNEYKSRKHFQWFLTAFYILCFKSSF